MEDNFEHKLIFRGIVGSQSYGLATETSDVDYKSVFIQSNDDILSNNYTPQIDINADDVAYEIRRFLELVSVGNPNVLELLYLPEHCIVQSSPEWEFLKKHRKEFLSKKCYHTFSGYAKTQLNKATGLNKKFNYEKERRERKNIIDFSKVIDRQSGNTFKVKDWLKEHGYKQEQVGLTSIDGFRDCYRFYVDDIKWASDNHRFDNMNLINRGYRGIGDEDTNEPRKSVVEKYMIDSWKGIMYFNRESYSTHCKNYRDYLKWLKNRNEDRVATNKKHGQEMDGKNILHLVRLIMTAKEIPTHHHINVDRSSERDFLLSIKHGEVDLKKIVKDWSKETEDLKELYINSDLKEEVDLNFIKELELKIRKNEI